MRKNGFTLIELLISIGIIAILASVGFVNLYGYFQRKNLDLTGQEITAVLRNAQNNSISQEGGNQWGVHFENTTSTDDADFYVLFYGASYAVSTSSQRSVLPSGVNFSNPPAGMSFDVIFAPATGITTSTVISIIGTSNGTVKDIVIKSNGGVVDNLEEGLVGYWHFDEGLATSTYDASGYANTGTLTNDPTWTSGASCKSGGCISFDTSAQKYISIINSDSIGVETTLTLSAWIRPIGVGGSDSYGTIMVSYMSGYYLSFRDASNALSCYWYDTVPAGYHTTLNETVPLDKWTHVACVWDGSNLNQYINGVLSKITGVTGVGAGPSNLRIGAESIARQFEGSMDEVRIYNRALSATEVLKLYNDFK